MKNTLLIFCFFILTHSLYATGFSDWNYKTSNGTTIADPGSGVNLYTKYTDENLQNLDRWYFYKDYIIGEYEIFKNPEWKTAYFILNESDGKITTYDTKTLFEAALMSQELVPTFWTRWYYDHYSIFQLIFILYLISWPVAIGILLFISLLIFLSIALKHRILKIIFIVITGILFLPVLLFVLNDLFTSSF